MSGMLRSLRRVWPGSRDVPLHRLKPLASQPPPPSKPDESKPLSNEQRLGDVVWKPEQEFPGGAVIGRRAVNLSREAQVLRRIAQPARLVLSLSAYEAHLLCCPRRRTR
ncbi:hypothetical protein PRNP1_001643 [Phytophthora ramorum]